MKYFVFIFTMMLKFIRQRTKIVYNARLDFRLYRLTLVYKNRLLVRKLDNMIIKWKLKSD